MPILQDVGLFPHGALKEQIETLSMEAGLISNLAHSFQNIVPSIQEAVVRALEPLKSEVNKIHDDAVTAEKEINKISKNRAQLRFVDYSAVLVDVPEGFKGNYKEYLSALTKINQSMILPSLDEIKKYNTMLAQFISSKDGRITVRDHSAIADNVDKTASDLEKSLSPYFDERSDLSKRPLGDVVKNFDDLDQMGRALSLLSSDHKRFDLKVFVREVEKTAEYLALIREEQDEQGIDRVSGPIAVAISKGGRAIAEFVTLVALARFRTETAIVAASKVVRVFGKH